MGAGWTTNGFLPEEADQTELQRPSDVARAGDIFWIQRAWATTVPKEGQPQER